MADRPRWLTVGAFLVLTLLVGLGALDGLDRSLEQVFRPDMVWTTWQVRAQQIERVLAPVWSFGVVGVVALVVAVRRRSVLPLVVSVVGIGATGVLALGVKLLLRRPDPNLEVTGAGSFPSGHTAAFTVSVGLLLLLTVGLAGWRWLVVALAGTVMGLCLVVEGAHWFSDVLGGGLLAGTVLAFLGPFHRRFIWLTSSNRTEPVEFQWSSAGSSG